MKPMLRQSGKQHTLRSLSLAAASLLIGLCVYTFALLLPLPVQFVYGLRTNLLWVSLAVFPLLWMAFRTDRWGHRTAAFSLTMALFGLALSGLWSSGSSEPFAVAGLLPFSDASSYYADAQRVLEGGLFSVFSARRPLLAAYLVPLLGLTGRSLQAALAIMVAVGAIACYLAARQVKKTNGPWAAALFWLLLFIFYRRLAGTTMTENLGLPFGALGFTLLWHSAHEKKPLPAYGGLFLMALALNARAGAFFALPALLFWGALALSGKRKFSWAFLMGGAASIAAGFLINFLLLKLLAVQGGMAFSNFSDTLYGAVAGGMGWEQVVRDHPEVARMSDPERSSAIYAFAWQAFQEHPTGILTGALRNWGQFLAPRGAGAFGFVRGLDAAWVNYTFRIVLSLLSGWALWQLVRRLKQPSSSLLAAASIGIFLSVPFAPPFDSNQMRVYAATIPFLAVLPALGLADIVRRAFRKGQAPFTASTENPAHQAVLLGGVMIVFIIAGSLLFKTFSRPTIIETPLCPNDQQTMLIRIPEGSTVQISKDAPTPDRLPIISLEHFSRYYEGYPELHAELVTWMAANPGDLILLKPLDLSSLAYPFIIARAELLQPGAELWSVCLLPIQGVQTGRYGFFELISALPVNP